MKRYIILHILRNPYGYSQEDREKARLLAADEIENLEDAFENMKDFVIESGLDINTYQKI